MNRGWPRGKRKRSAGGKADSKDLCRSGTGQGVRVVAGNSGVGMGTDCEGPSMPSWSSDLNPVDVKARECI